MTDIADSIGGEYDLTNILLGIPALFVAIAMAFFGFQSNNLGLLVAGLVLFLLPATGLILTKGNLLKSPFTLYYSAVGYLLGYAVFLVPGFVQKNFSVMSTPSSSYLSTALGETSVQVTSIMNNFLAPRGENMAILGLSVLLMVGVKRATDSNILAGMFAILPSSIAFALLHGARTIGFLLLAGGFMAIWIILYIGDEFGLEIASDLGVGMFALTVGLHQSNNVSASGGVVEYYSTILSAPEPVIYISYLIVAIDVFLVGYVGYKTLSFIADGEFPF